MLYFSLPLSPRRNGTILSTTSTERGRKWLRIAGTQIQKGQDKDIYGFQSWTSQFSYYWWAGNIFQKGNSKCCLGSSYLGLLRRGVDIYAQQQIYWWYAASFKSDE